MLPIIIIGSGLAGYNMVKGIRKINADLRILVITKDAGDVYSKPMLSNALAADKTPDSLVSANAQKMAKDYHLEIMTHTSVQSIDTKNNQVVTEQGNFAYRDLVLALGADPITIPFPGNALSHILQVNNLEDYQVYYAKLQQCKHISIIGSGLIGCEFANDLLLAGKKVSVIGIEQYPLQSLLPEAVGRLLQKKLASIGIDWQLGRALKSINYENEHFRLCFEMGADIDTDLIVSAVGLKPKTKLASDAKLQVKRGIVADQYCRTSVSNVYAIGDCAEINGKNRLFVMPILQSTKALAKTLTGTECAVNYPLMPISIKTKSYPVSLAGEFCNASEWQHEVTDSGSVSKSWLQNKLMGFVLTGDAHREKNKLLKLLKG